MENLVDAGTRTLGHTGISVGPLAFGCWRFTHDHVRDARAVLDAALEHGMHLVDTADVYGLDWGGTGFGSVEGRKLEGLLPAHCDGAGYRLYGADFCAPEHTLTVVNIAAEWCGPCQFESSVMTETLVRPYAARGVRFVRVRPGAAR